MRSLQNMLNRNAPLSTLEEVNQPFPTFTPLTL